MKPRIILILTFIFALSASWTRVSAAPEWNPSGNTTVGTNVQTEWSGVNMMKTSTTPYQSQIYEVGTMSVPSDYSSPAGGANAPQKVGPRKLGGGTDPGQQSEEYPIGEPWIMVLFALAACGMIAYRKKKTNDLKQIISMENKNSNTNNHSVNKANRIISRNPMRKFLATLLLVTLGVGQMWGAWIGNSGIQVNGTWYKSSSNIDGGNWLAGCTSFASANLGALTTLELGGQYETYDNSQTDYCSWNSSNGIHILIKKGASEIANFKLSCYHDSKSGNNNVWKTSGGTGGCSDSGSWGTYSVDISGYAAGEYTIKVTWFSPSGQSLNNTANFTINPIVTFKANGGTGSDYTQTVTYNSATALTPCTFTRSSYAFDGWATSAGGAVSYADGANVTLTAHTNLFAKWVAEETHDVTVSYKCSTATIKDATTESGVGVTTARNVTAPDIDGYTFSSWTVGNGITNNTGNTTTNPININTKGSGSYTLTANYTPKACKLSKFSTAKNGTETDKGAMTFDATTKAYYKDITTDASPFYFRFNFNSGTYYSTDWAAGGYNSGKTVTANGDKVDCDQNVTSWGDKPSIVFNGLNSSAIRIWFDYQAKKVWITEATYSVTVNNGDHGTVSPNGSQSVGKNSGKSITATPATGWKFASWTKTGSAVLSSTSTNPTTVTATGTGTVTPTYAHRFVLRGSTVASDATTAGMAGWSANDNSSYTSVTISDGVMTITANLTSANTQYKFLIRDLVNNSYKGQTGTSEMSDGETWTLNGSNDVKFTTTIAGTYTFTYNCSTGSMTIGFPTTYTLTYSIGSVAGNDGSISSSPSTASGSHIAGGSTVTLTAPSEKTGYSWKGWYLNADGSGVQQCATKAYTVTMNANKTLYACYTANTYTVTFDNDGGSASPGSKTVTYDAAPGSVTFPTKSNYAFDGYYTSGGVKVINKNGNWVNGVDGFTDGSGNWNGTSDQTLYAHWLAVGWYIVGPFAGGWDAAAANKFDDVNYKCTINVANHSIYSPSYLSEFKICRVQANTSSTLNETLYGKNSGGTPAVQLGKENKTASGLTNGAYDHSIKLELYYDGDYVFTLNTSGPDITVDVPVIDQLQIYSSSPSSDAAIGNYNWDGPIVSNAVSKTLTLSAKTTYQFKGVYDSEFYSKSSGSITRASSSLSGLTKTGSEGNMSITTDAAGSYTFTLNTSDKTMTVTYPTAYTITYGVGTIKGCTSVTVTPSFSSGDYVLAETDVTFTKTSTKDGYTWKGWYSDEAGTATCHSATNANLSWTATRTGNISVYACYTKNTYTITYHLNGGTQQVSPAPTMSYTVTDAVTLPTTPTKDGYRFGGWYDNAELTGSPVTSFAAGQTGHKNYYAKWIELITYDVYYYNKDKWATPYAYFWINGGAQKKAFPGDEMTYHQNMVYKYGYESADGWNRVIFSDGTNDHKTGDLTLPANNQMFYNPDDAAINSGSIHYGWTQYIMVAAFPTETIAAVLGEKVTVEPVVAWASGINFSDISITSVRTDGPDDATINATIAGTKIMVSGVAAGTATFRITYSYGGTTITKDLNIEIKNGVTIQAKIAKTDTHWTDTKLLKMHYWGTGIGNSNLTMTWMKADDDYNYYQACVPKGSDDKANFLFYYDYMEDTDANRWRQTADQTNVTSERCYTIGYEGHNNVKSTCTSVAGHCAESWQIQIVMGSGDVYTSNIVGTSDEIISFFAPGNKAGDPSYRKGTVTLEQNGQTKATLTTPLSPAVFSESGVYTAKVKITSPFGLTNVELYDGDYYIRTDGASGGWENYMTDPNNKMTYFTRNTNFPNESFSYYWVANVAHGSSQNIKATVANDYNPVLCNFTPDETANEPDGINLRFGYEPTTNDIVRGIVGGSTTNNYLNLVCPSGSQIYKEIECTTLLNESHYSSTPLDSKFGDKSNWVYEIIVYAKIDDDHDKANVVLKSYYYGIHNLLGMVKDEYGRETSAPVQFSVIKTGTTNGIYGLRVVYDFKTNRLFAAWAPADRVVDGVLSVDADVMFIRHEDGDAAQISFNTNASKIEDLKQAIFALELDNENSFHGGSGNIERHYFISLPFDCQVSNIFGLNGFMNYWGIQRYRGDLRAQKGWFQDTPTFWEWLDADDVMQAGEGYLLSVDKKALENDNVWKDGITYQVQVPVLDGSGDPIPTEDGLADSVVWETRAGSMITMYFPSTTSGFEISPATGAALTLTYPNQECTITRDDRNHKDSNWKCIGTPGYKNINVNTYSATDVPYNLDEETGNENRPPKFLYIFNEQTTGARWASGTYTVTDGSAFTYHSFNSYMVQYAGTINWAQYSKGDVVSPIVARRAKSEETKLTRTQIDLLSAEDESLDRTFVWLQGKATEGFDQNFDLNKMVENKANQIYSLALTDIPFAANVLPLETDTVPLVVNIVNAGEYTLALDKDKHVGQAPILYDMYAGEKTNLLNADYTVELQKGKYEGRFFLLFTPEKPIVTSFETTEDGGMKTRGNEAIYDVLGRRVNTVYPEHIYIVNGEKKVFH